MSAIRKIRSGVFLAPFHPLDEDPTLAIQRDMELMEHLDRLGYDEAWIGEHHSGGYEIIGSPELFIAAAAERTRRIVFGTGVISLPYHHPLHVADRIVQLDHQTRGRVMFGVGPGLLASDATMLGIPIDKQRDRMVEALEVILRLMAGEVVSHTSEWFSLKDARLQLRPYTLPRPYVAVASSITPSGGTLAGRLGLGLLCLAATNTQGYNNLDANWKIARDTGAANGHALGVSDLRVVGPMHIAETREQAFADCEFGYDKFTYYTNTVNPRSAIDVGLSQTGIEDMVRVGQAVIGTPDDAVAQLERLWSKTGGFGAYLHLAHNWADFAATKKSYELYARYVLPKFEARNRPRVESLNYIDENSAALTGASVAAIKKTFEKLQPSGTSAPSEPERVN